MKFLQSEKLANITTLLSNLVQADCRITGRVEAYSCKAAGDNKKLYKHLEFRFADDMEDYGGMDMPIVSPFGPLNMQASRKTLYYLIATLNASYPDYDFSNVKPEQFSKQQHIGMVVNSINVSLSSSGTAGAELLQTMWPAIDHEIQLKDCDIYLFTPDVDSDPAGDESGCIWSLYYFFYNKKLKRIVFLTCRAISNLSMARRINTRGYRQRARGGDDDDVDDDMMDDDIDELDDDDTETNFDYDNAGSTANNSSMVDRGQTRWVPYEHLSGVHTQS